MLNASLEEKQCPCERDTTSLTPSHNTKVSVLERQYCGQLLVAADSAEFIAMNAGKNLLYWGKAPHIARTVERIMDITAEELRTAAQHIVFDRCSSLTFT